MGPLTLARERFLDYDMFGLISGQVTQDRGVKINAISHRGGVNKLMRK